MQYARAFISKNGRVRVRTYGYPSLKVTVRIRAVPKPGKTTRYKGPPLLATELEDGLTNGQNAGSRFARAVGLRPAISQTHRIRVPHDLLEVERVYAGLIPTRSPDGRKTCRSPTTARR